MHTFTLRLRSRAGCSVGFGAPWTWPSSDPHPQRSTLNPQPSTFPERLPPIRKYHPRHRGKTTVSPPFAWSHDIVFIRLCPNSAKDKVKPGDWLEKCPFSSRTPLRLTR